MGETAQMIALTMGIMQVLPCCPAPAGHDVHLNCSSFGPPCYRVT